MFFRETLDFQKLISDQYLNDLVQSMDKNKSEALDRYIEKRYKAIEESFNMQRYSYGSYAVAYQRIFSISIFLISSLVFSFYCSSLIIKQASTMRKFSLLSS